MPCPGWIYTQRMARNIHPSILTKFTSTPATNLEAAECAVDPTVASQQEGPDLEPAGQVRPFYVGFERVSSMVYFIVVFYLRI